MRDSLIYDETRLFVAANGRRYRIQFNLDDDRSPPWDDDGAIPILWTEYHHGRSYICSKGNRGFDLVGGAFDRLTDRQIKAHLAELVAMCDGLKPWCKGHEDGAYWFTDAASFDAFARAERPHLTLREARRDVLREWLPITDGHGAREMLDTAAKLWTLQGVPAEVIESRGYSQGDFCEVLAVAHPDAVAAFGFRSMAAYRKVCPDDLKSAAYAFGAWMWGGVIGYTVARIDSDEWEEVGGDDLNGLTLCEVVDSCWGFYPEGTSDYFPLETAHAYAIGEAEAAAEADSLEWGEACAAAMAAEIEAARPDLVPGALA